MENKMKLSLISSLILLTLFSGCTIKNVQNDLEDVFSKTKQSVLVSDESELVELFYENRWSENNLIPEILTSYFFQINGAIPPIITRLKSNDEELFFELFHGGEFDFYRLFSTDEGIDIYSFRIDQTLNELLNEQKELYELNKSLSEDIAFNIDNADKLLELGQVLDGYEYFLYVPEEYLDIPYIQSLDFKFASFDIDYFNELVEDYSLENRSKNHDLYFSLNYQIYSGADNLDEALKHIRGLQVIIGESPSLMFYKSEIMAKHGLPEADKLRKELLTKYPEFYLAKESVSKS